MFINEWMADNDGVVTDPKDGQAESWFELFNPGNQTVDLSGWYLTGNVAKRSQFLIPDGFQLSPGGYLLVWADGEPAQNTPFSGDLHVNFQLTNSSVIGLFAPDGNQADLVELVKGTPGKSYGSRVDGQEPILETAVPTPRTSNTRIVARSITLLASEDASVVAFSGLPSAGHRVLASTNLAGDLWSDVAGMLANPLGDFSFSNPAVSSFPQRYFRAVSP